MSAELIIKMTAQYAEVTTALKEISGSSKQTADDIGLMGSAFKGFAGALVGGLSLGLVVNTMKQTINEMAALDDASEKTGASVESLSSMLNTLKPSGATLSTIEQMGQVLSRATSQAEIPTSRAARAFKTLGVELLDADKKARPMDQVYKDLALSLNKYADDGQKSLLVTQALGYAGVRFLPYLKDLATTQMAQATVTAESAKKAEDLQKALGRLQVAFEGLKVELAGPLMDWLTRFIDELNSGTRAAGGFWAALLKIGLRNPMESASESVDNISSEIKKLQTELDGLNRAATGPFKAGLESAPVGPVAPGNIRSLRAARENEGLTVAERKAAEARIAIVRAEITEKENIRSFYQGLEARDNAANLKKRFGDFSKEKEGGLPSAPKSADRGDAKAAAAQQRLDNQYASTIRALYATQDLSAEQLEILTEELGKINLIVGKDEDRIKAARDLIPYLKEHNKDLKEQAKVNEEVGKQLKKIRDEEDKAEERDKKANKPQDVARESLAGKAWAEFSNLFQQTIAYTEEVKRQVLSLIDSWERMGDISSETAQEMKDATLGVSRIKPITAQQRPAFLQNTFQSTQAGDLKRYERDLAAIREAYKNMEGPFKDAFDTGGVRAMDDLLKQMEKTIVRVQDPMIQFGQILTSAFEDAIFAGKGLGDIFKGLLIDIAKLIMRQQLLNPLAEFVGGGKPAAGAPSTFFSWLIGLFTKEAGGPVTAGATYKVGERGPEIVVPRPSQVRPFYVGMGGPERFTPATDAIIVSSQDSKAFNDLRSSNQSSTFNDLRKTDHPTFNDLRSSSQSSTFNDLRVTSQFAEVITDDMLRRLGVRGKRATGGYVEARKAWLVGERGPEIVVPKVDSVVIPNHVINNRNIESWPQEFRTVVQNYYSDIDGWTSNVTNASYTRQSLAHLANVQPRAAGGLASAGMPYLVGERGKEAIFPVDTRRGSAQRNTSDGVTIQQHFDFRNSLGVAETVEAAARRGAAYAQSMLADSRRRGAN